MVETIGIKVAFIASLLIYLFIYYRHCTQT